MANPLDQLRDVVVRFAQIGKLKLDVNFLRRDRDALIQRLGEAAFDLLDRRELVDHPALSELVSAIRAIDARRTEGLRAAEAIRSEIVAEPSKT